MYILYPNLEIKIIIEATHKPLEKLLANELDVAITSDPASDKSIKYVELFKDEVIAIVQKENGLAHKKYLNATDFSDQTLIIHSYPMETITVYQHFLKDQKVHPKNIIAIPLTEVALEMVKSDRGIMTLPGWALRPFVSSPDLQQIKIGQKGLIRIHYAAIRHEDAKKKHILDFIENFKELTNR